MPRDSGHRLKVAAKPTEHDDRLGVGQVGQPIGQRGLLGGCAVDRDHDAIIDAAEPAGRLLESEQLHQRVARRDGAGCNLGGHLGFHAVIEPQRRRGQFDLDHFVDRVGQVEHFVGGHPPRDAVEFRGQFVLPLPRLDHARELRMRVRVPRPHRNERCAEQLRVEEAALAEQVEGRVGHRGAGEAEPPCVLVFRREPCKVQAGRASRCLDAVRLVEDECRPPHRVDHLRQVFPPRGLVVDRHDQRRAAGRSHRRLQPCGPLLAGAARQVNVDKAWAVPHGNEGEQGGERLARSHVGGKQPGVPVAEPLDETVLVIPRGELPGRKARDHLTPRGADGLRAADEDVRALFHPVERVMPRHSPPPVPAAGRGRRQGSSRRVRRHGPASCRCSG